MILRHNKLTRFTPARRFVLVTVNARGNMQALFRSSYHVLRAKSHSMHPILRSSLRFNFHNIAPARQASLAARPAINFIKSPTSSFPRVGPGVGTLATTLGLGLSTLYMGRINCERKRCNLFTRIYLSLKVILQLYCPLHLLPNLNLHLLHPKNLL